jgi:CheY-like chemotaxis protein
MSRILLVDDSPHAQRIGERILADEGFEVVTVSTGDSALIRLDDVEPDVVVADTVMPGRNGYDICHYLKLSPRHRHVKVILTAGVMDALDEEELKHVGADGTLRKPFEATALIAAVKPLAEAVAAARAAKSVLPSAGRPFEVPALSKAAAPFVAVLDAEQVRAAVTIALDAAMGDMVDEITRRVLSALTAKRPAAEPQQAQAAAAVSDDSSIQAAPADSSTPRPAPARTSLLAYTETVRRVTPVRVRPGSILGLDPPPAEVQESESPSEQH